MSRNFNLRFESQQPPCRLSSVVLSSTGIIFNIMTDTEKTMLNLLGAKLRSYRLQKNISQEKFAELTELDRTYISGLERGKRNPSYLVINRICKILKLYY